jgi:hypothetical protein
MKCLKNSKTGEIVRVEDKQAYQMEGVTWKYVSKEEWKNTKNPKEDVVVGHDMGGSYEIKKNKTPLKRKKRSTKEIEDQYDIGGSE